MYVNLIIFLVILFTEKVFNKNDKPHIYRGTYAAIENVWEIVNTTNVYT